jgi:hypothetical protein
MPRRLCKCGYSIPSGEIPCPYEWDAISNVSFDRFPEVIEMEKVLMVSTIVLKCPECGRLLVFKNGFDKAPVIYKQEEPPFKKTEITK